MSENYRLAAEFQFFIEDMDPAGQRLLSLAFPLVELGREDVAGYLVDLAQEPADPGSGLVFPDDDTLAHLLRCVPIDERARWLLAMDRLVLDDDAPRFERLMDLLAVRLAK
ncbi:MAG: hypothetical protein HWE39_23280 [Oceanospirillaceae bacterium]|uniref:hypothetical protein n=1 Tax=Salipiger sp. HF18 TaxID=2721557 RepID=UPI00142D35D7|nr:hypothetical protein [Salipiger sp. HF18]NIY97283.1 hypothetical protein [Salipiger sp. HF18]NVK44175.1 hypothetical protein [Oceanospirillaceae bacterium]